jgi:hypothetical protein
MKRIGLRTDSSRTPLVTPKNSSCAIRVRVREGVVEEADIRAFAELLMSSSGCRGHGVEEFLCAHVPVRALAWGNAMAGLEVLRCSVEE